MQIIQGTPPALPGNCRVCGSATREWYLDTGYSEEYVGAIYYCCVCIADIGRVCGFITPEDAEKYKARLEEAHAEVYQLRTVLETTWKGLDELRIRGLSVAASPAPVGPNVPLLETLESTADAAPGGTDQLGAGTGTAPESSDDEGVAELPADAGSPRSEFRLDL